MRRTPANDLMTHRAVYAALNAPAEFGKPAFDSGGWLKQRLAEARQLPCSLPDRPGQLMDWMVVSSERAGAQYQAYLKARKAGAPRRFFRNLSHALAFLRGVAPTKLVDGSWLYGAVKQWRNPRYFHLVKTYVEELGDGRSDRNHVLLYRQLLAAHDIEAPAEDLPDDRYTQGAIQLALSEHGDDLLPEIIGFNLGYEQLPLHLPITAYELNELGLDPYYFTLHVTVDNHDTGHARRAVAAVMDAMPQIGDTTEFWNRVRDGFQLNDLGAGTNDVIAQFDQQAEVERIFIRKSAAGRAAHADYCKVSGRSVNDWLSDPRDVPAFLQALEKAGWIVRNAPPQESRLWKLLDGDHAEMFGVFSQYELQVIQDWIRGDASSDGAAVAEDASKLRKPASFRASQRLASARGMSGANACSDISQDDPDVEVLLELLARQTHPDAAMNLLVNAMAPARHWMPAGLMATQRFLQTLKH